MNQEFNVDTNEPSQPGSELIAQDADVVLQVSDDKNPSETNMIKDSQEENESVNKMIDDITTDMINKLKQYVSIQNTDTNVEDEIKNILKQYKQYLSYETLKEIDALISKMEIKVSNQGLITFHLHDTIGFYLRDSSTKKCNGIHIFIPLIQHLVTKINNNSISFKQNFTIVKSAKITIGEGLKKSKIACVGKVRIFRSVVVNGGSKSRRRHRRHAHKTRRGHGRGRSRKPKAKSKTHRRRRHSRVRKHKKNTYTRRR